MAGYALYLPGVKGSDPNHLRRVGLDGLLLEGSPEFAEITEHGPDGKMGMMAAFCKGDIATDPPFTPKAYVWQPAKACKRRELPEGRFFFGTVRDKPVAPRDILRKGVLTGLGKYVDLRDGNAWHIPEAVNLPHVHGLNGDGEFERQVSEQYREFWEISKSYAVTFCEAIDQLEALKSSNPKNLNPELVIEFPLAEGWEYCCKALAINYRLTPELIDMLGLLDDVGARNIIKVTVGLWIILEVRDQKKTDGISIPVG